MTPYAWSRRNSICALRIGSAATFSFLKCALTHCSIVQCKPESAGWHEPILIVLHNPASKLHGVGGDALSALSAKLHSVCLPIEQVSAHIGETKCVSGKVITVSPGPSGTTVLNFCEDGRQCPFTAVVFARDLRDVGDVRQLAGTLVELHGKITEYDGHPEIIFRESRQLRGQATRLPPIPKEYDVERRGHYSAGKFKHPKQKRKRQRRSGHDPGTAGELASDDSTSPE